MTINGKKTDLGVTDPHDRAGADAAFARLIAEAAGRIAAQLSGMLPPGGGPPPAPPAQPPDPPPDPGPTVAAAADAYLAECDRKVRLGKLAADTRRNYGSILKALRAEFADRPLRGLGGAEVEEWADRPAWSPTYRRLALSVVTAAAAWSGVALKLDRPAAESRGADAVVSDDNFAAVVADWEKREPNGDFPALLTVLRECGGRPQEVAGLTAADVEWPLSLARVKNHKTRKKTGKPKVIHFTPAAMAVLERQRLKHPDGPLFRGRRGGAFSKDVIAKRMREASKRLGVKVIAYGLRHTFCTRALLNGVPETLVAALVGHASTAMIAKHYSHVGANAEALKAALEKARKAG